jgi:hypothetical protein
MKFLVYPMNSSRKSQVKLYVNVTNLEEIRKERKGLYNPDEVRTDSLKSQMGINNHRRKIYIIKVIIVHI